MKRVFSAGGIVFKKEDNQLKFLLAKNESIKDPNVHYWGFPKGHLEEGENSENTALREVLEETGIKAKIMGKVGYSKYTYSSPREGGKAFKVVTIFLMEFESGEAKNQLEEISEVGWFAPEEALEKLSFSQDKLLFKKAVEMYGQL